MTLTADRSPRSRRVGRGEGGGKGGGDGPGDRGSACEGRLETAGQSSVERQTARGADAGRLESGDKTSSAFFFVTFSFLLNVSFFPFIVFFLFPL